MKANGSRAGGRGAQRPQRREPRLLRQGEEIVERRDVMWPKSSGQHPQNLPLRFDKCGGAEALEGGGRGRDHARVAQGRHERVREIGAVAGHERGAGEPAFQFDTRRPHERAVAQLLLKGGRVLVTRVLAQAVARNVAPVGVDLVRDDAEHGLRDRLAGLQQPTGKPQGAELQCEAKPVLGFAAAADTSKIVVVQRIATSALALVVGETEQCAALAGGEDASVRHSLMFAAFVEL